MTLFAQRNTRIAALPLLAALPVLAALTGCLSTSSAEVAAELRESRHRLAEAAVRGESGSGLPVAGGALTLRDACNLALANNLALRATFLRRSSAAGVIEEARGEALPQVGLTGQASSVLEERGENPDRLSAGLRITQPVWRSGAVEAGLRYARLYAASTDAEIRQQVQTTLAQVAGLYLDSLRQQHLVSVYEEAQAVAERLRQTAGNKRAAGTVSDYEVLRAEVEVSTARADLLQARNNLRTTMIALLHALGVDQQSVVTLSGTLAYQAESYADADLVRRALASRADLLIGEAAIRMAQARVDALRGEYGPKVDLFVGGEAADPDPNDASRGRWNDRWTAGATLTLTVFDGFIRRGRLTQAVSRQRQAEADLKHAEEAVRVEVAKALLDLRYADELYQSQRKNIELAREALRMLESGFRMGRNTQIEVLDAQSALTAAMGRYYNAVHLHSRARLDIRRTLGILGPDADVIVGADYQLEADPLAP